jgi:transposase
MHVSPSLEVLMLYSGIDLHRRSCTITTIDDKGSIVQEATLRTASPLVASYFRRLPGPQVATVEACGGWYWLADLLRTQQVDLTLAHAKFVKAIAYAKVKTDAVDALTLAQLLRTGFIPEAHMISPELRPLRDVLRARLRLVEKQVSAQVSTERLLEKYNVATPEELPEMARLQAACLEEQVRLLKRQTKRLERALHPHLLPNPDVQRLLWVPGIGKVGAFTLYLEVDGIERFPTAKHFFSYCRLVPGSRNSAGKERHRRSKDGNRYLKLAFSHAAVRATQYYPEIKRFFERQARRKNRPIARALVAKEIARACYHVLQGEEFNGKFKGAVLSRTKEPKWPRRASPGA